MNGDIVFAVLLTVVVYVSYSWGKRDTPDDKVGKADVVYATVLVFMCASLCLYIYCGSNHNVKTIICPFNQAGLY